MHSDTYHKILTFVASDLHNITLPVHMPMRR